jgi:drug/metabolite transporter (DMT)-like permease
VRPAVAAALALVGFAANSLLCRAAIGAGAIDPATFTIVRMVSGFVMLAALVRFRGLIQPRAFGSGFALALYAVAFAFAYERLGAATGALLLFGSVQLTMMTAALRAGERPRPLEWVGYALALAGLALLVAPGLSAPPLGAALLMAAAGIAWGIYTLRGRGATDPLAESAANFARAIPFALAGLVIPLFTGTRAHLSGQGVALAIASGALASGLGYALWYRALPSLTAARAATLQLAVPVLAAIGGVLFLAEGVSVRLVAASLLVLGGIGLAVRFRK